MEGPNGLSKRRVRVRDGGNRAVLKPGDPNYKKLNPGLSAEANARIEAIENAQKRAQSNLGRHLLD